MPLIAADAMKEEVAHQHHRKERGHPGNVVQVIILITAECDLVPIIILCRLCAILILDEMVRAAILIRQRLPLRRLLPAARQHERRTDCRKSRKDRSRLRTDMDHDGSSFFGYNHLFIL